MFSPVMFVMMGVMGAAGLVASLIPAPVSSGDVRKAWIVSGGISGALVVLTVVAAVYGYV